MTARGALSSALTEDSYYTSGSAGCTQSCANCVYTSHSALTSRNKRKTANVIDGLTLDGYGKERVERIIHAVKDHSYQPNPVRRQYIKKKSGKMRPLGISSSDDKLVEEVIKMILESIYDPTFSNYSHGFRPGRSCHTALLQLQQNFTGVKWFVEGDIKSYFDTIDHHSLINILRRRNKDEAFIELIWKFLNLEKQKQEEENVMIVQAVRSLKLTPAELLSFLDNPNVSAPGQLVPKHGTRKEDSEHEE